MNLTALTLPAEPWFHLLAASASDATDALWALERGQAAKVAVRFVRGRKATTAAHFFDEVAAALQFPYYFGENWDALNDCITDLEWLHAGAVVLCVTDAGRLLEASAADASKFVAVIKAAAKAWNHQGKSNTAKAFHIVMQSSVADEAATRQRWQALGLTLNKLN